MQQAGETKAEIVQILASFEQGAPLRVCAYRANHIFLRFHGAQAKRKIYQPNYWVDGTALGTAFGRAGQFENWLPDADIRKIAKTYYRDIAAICHNWNALQDNELWKIELRSEETVEGLEGPIAPQPTFQAGNGTSATTSMLQGGAKQVYLNPLTPFICTPISWMNI